LPHRPLIRPMPEYATGFDSKPQNTKRREKKWVRTRWRKADNAVEWHMDYCGAVTKKTHFSLYKSGGGGGVLHVDRYRCSNGTDEESTKGIIFMYAYTAIFSHSDHNWRRDSRVWETITFWYKVTTNSRLDSRQLAWSMERYNYSLEPRLNARLLHLPAALTNKTTKTRQSSIADFVPVATNRIANTRLCVYHGMTMVFTHWHPLCEKMTSFAKPEVHKVHNVLHWRQRRTEPRPRVRCAEDFAKYTCTFCHMRADWQTNTQT